MEVRVMLRTILGSYQLLRFALRFSDDTRIPPIQPVSIRHDCRRLFLLLATGAETDCDRLLLRLASLAFSSDVVADAFLLLVTFQFRAVAQWHLAGSQQPE